MINDKILVGNVLLNNRVLLQPMEGADGTAAGDIGELTKRRYLRFAESGASVIWFEAVAVCNEGRANPRQLFLNDCNINQYKQLIKEIKEKSFSLFGYSPKIIIQLTHSGRQANCTGIHAPIVAYRSAYLEEGKEDYNYVVASDKYLDSIPKMYKKSARLAVEAGFDGIDVKCCHGYLMAELMSAYIREGKYGGSFENRSKLFLNCIYAVKEEIGQDIILTSRINASDCYQPPNGFGVDSQGNINLDECIKVLKKLEKCDVGLINISLGNPYLIPHINRPYKNSPESIEIGMNRFKKVLLEIKARTNMVVVASALTPSGENCMQYSEELLKEGACDIVGFGRMAFAYPTFYADYLKEGKIDKKKLCILCGNCTQLMRNGGEAGCPIRDADVYLPLYKKYVLKKEQDECNNFKRKRV